MPCGPQRAAHHHVHDAMCHLQWYIVRSQDQRCLAVTPSDLPSALYRTSKVVLTSIGQVHWGLRLAGLGIHSSASGAVMLSGKTGNHPMWVLVKGC